MVGDVTRVGKVMMKHIGIVESNLSGSGFEGLRIAKELRARVTFFTRDLQRYLEVPGGPRYFEEYVDEIVFCETNDLAPLLDAVRRIDESRPFAALLTLGEYDVVVAAQAARALGLVTVDPDGIAVARNKLWMRERCAEHGVPMPRFAAAGSAAEVEDAVHAVGLPCVVKPVDETSSADVARCHRTDEAVSHFELIRSKPENTRGQRRYPQILIEEAVQGFEVSVEAIAEDRRVRVLGVTDKTLTGAGAFVEAAHVFPSLLPADVVAECSAVAEAALRAVGFDLGMAHVEIRVAEDGAKLIEINPRPAGGKITELVDRSLGISCLDLVIRQYLGERVLDGVSTDRCGGAAIRYLTSIPGRVAAVTGVEVAAQMPGVEEVVVKVRPGDDVRAPKRNGDRLGHVLAVGEDPYLASRRAESAAHEIVVATLADGAKGEAAPPASGRPPRRPADSIEELIGGTPLVRLALPDLPADITALGKLEMANPLSSSKDRASLFMLRAAERRGDLAPGRSTIVEASSGNTGISLAALAAARGYGCVIVLPDSATRERRQILRALGAEVVVTPRAAGYRGAIAKAEQLRDEIPGAWLVCQHENADNVRAHFETTGPEIWTDCNGCVDALVCGVGTGGTLTGAARYLKQRNPDLHVVAVEPEGSPVLSGGPGGLHAIPGLNGGFVAPTTDVSCIDEIVVVSDNDAASTARLLARSSGLLVGISSGAAAHACQQVAKRLRPGATVVAVLPDAGERYLSLWDDAGAAPTVPSPQPEVNAA
jgi:cysteine synthase A